MTLHELTSGEHTKWPEWVSDRQKQDFLDLCHIFIRTFSNERFHAEAVVKCDPGQTHDVMQVQVKNKPLGRSLRVHIPSDDHSHWVFTVLCPDMETQHKAARALDELLCDAIPFVFGEQTRRIPLETMNIDGNQPT